MAIDDVGATVITLVEQHQRRLAAGLIGQSFAVLPGKEAVPFAHDHHEWSGDLGGEALERHVPRPFLRLFG